MMFININERTTSETRLPFNYALLINLFQKSFRKLRTSKIGPPIDVNNNNNNIKIEYI